MGDIILPFLRSIPSERDDADRDDPRSELVRFLLLDIQQHFDHAIPELEQYFY
jgi:hypothetical protein